LGKLPKFPVRIIMGPILLLLCPIIKRVSKSSVPTPPIPRWKATPLLLRIVGVTTNYHNISADITYTFFCLKLNPSQSKNKLERWSVKTIQLQLKSEIWIIDRNQFQSIRYYWLELVNSSILYFIIHPAWTWLGMYWVVTIIIFQSIIVSSSLAWLACDIISFFREFCLWSGFLSCQDYNISLHKLSKNQFNQIEVNLTLFCIYYSS